MLSGKLWLDYGDGEDKEYWEANVTRGIFRDNEIVLEFSGQDRDYGQFQGACNLHKRGALYIGGGSFNVGQENTSASVSATVTREGNTVSLSGTWRDAGDRASYNLTVELESS